MKVMICPHCGREMPAPTVGHMRKNNYITICKECFTSVEMLEKIARIYLEG